MEEKARQIFLIKLYTQGFLIEDRKDSLILRPAGYALPAELIITEDEQGLWRVTGASGAYLLYPHPSSQLPINLINPLSSDREE